jgi:hypothetical protein
MSDETIQLCDCQENENLLGNPSFFEKAPELTGASTLFNFSLYLNNTLV